MPHTNEPNVQAATPLQEDAVNTLALLVGSALCRRAPAYTLILSEASEMGRKLISEKDCSRIELELTTQLGTSAPITLHAPVRGNNPSDLNTSMVEALNVQDHPLWSARVQEFKEWQKKSYKGSKSSKEAWTWEGSNSDKWSTTSTRGSSKRGQSVPVDLSKRANPEEKGLAWRDLEGLDTSLDFLFPETSLPCPVEKTLPLSSAQQDMYIHWICRSFALDRKTNKVHVSTVPIVT